MPDIELKLIGGREAWEPGETMEGSFHLSSAQDWTAEYIELILWWNTTGKGDRDEGVMHRESFATKGKRITTRRDFSFRLNLPKAPWTYHGRLIKIDWYVGVYAREKRKPEDAVIRPIRVFPGGRSELVAPVAPVVPDWAPPEE